jgi:hypothetical protein
MDTNMRSQRFSLVLASIALLFPLVTSAADETAGDAAIAAVVARAPDCLIPTRTVSPQTIVGIWNCAALVEVRASKPLRNGPPVVARALAIVHTCIYDAWAAYDDVAVGVTDVAGTRRQPLADRTEENKAKAISFAAHRCLRNLYPGDDPKARLDATLGYELDDATPSAVLGRLVAQAVIDFRANDGANQYGGAPCTDVCPTATVRALDPVPCEPVHYPWTAATVNQLGGAPPALQPLTCVGPGGTQTGPYADYDDQDTDYRHYVPKNPLMGFCSPLLAACPDPDDFIDPALPWPNVADPNHWQPLVFSSHSRQTFVGAHFRRVTPFALTSTNQFDSLLGPPPAYARNPVQYAQDVDAMIEYSASLDEARKLIVEYWADGPDSEFPPGHWGLFAQFVSRRDQQTTDQDAKMFFAMHNASFDAGIAAWHIKRKFNGVRPITAIRLTKLGQTIVAWGGPGRPTEPIPGEKWMPYNPGTNLTPPFPGFFSGHSVFSRSSATVLKLFTGGDTFGFSAVIPKCDVKYFGIDFLRCFGRVEPGIPSADTTVSFATFSDAADQAGLSRLYGGIHFPDDNTRAQQVGLRIGAQAWAKAQQYFNGTAR